MPRILSRQQTLSGILGRGRALILRPIPRLKLFRCNEVAKWAIAASIYCTVALSSSATLAQPLSPAAPAQAAAGTPADDGSWQMPAKNFAATRYSGLSE